MRRTSVTTEDLYFLMKKTSEAYFSIEASSNQIHGTAIEQFLLLLPETRFMKTSEAYFSIE